MSLDRRSFLKSALAAAGWGIVAPVVAERIPLVVAPAVPVTLPPWEFNHWSWGYAREAGDFVRLRIVGEVRRGGEVMILESFVDRRELRQAGGSTQLLVRRRMLAALEELNRSVHDGQAVESARLA